MYCCLQTWDFETRGNYSLQFVSSKYIRGNRLVHCYCVVLLYALASTFVKHTVYRRKLKLASIQCNAVVEGLAYCSLYILLYVHGGSSHFNGVLSIHMYSAELCKDVRKTLQLSRLADLIHRHSEFACYLSVYSLFVFAAQSQQYVYSLVALLLLLLREDMLH
jgi:hypothetical protein